MTKIEIFRKNGSIVGYKAVGHSGYADYGNDIVCAALSTALQIPLIGIQELLKENPKFEINEDGFLNVDLRKLSEKSKNEMNVSLESMYLFLKELSKQYPKNIKLVEKEDK